jgi:ribosomal protein S18 acetylase RimI-like enzyme
LRHNKVNEAALLVRSDNEKARALYEKEGFRCVDNSIVECIYALNL